MATDEIINKSVREAENPFLIQKKPKKKKKGIAIAILFALLLGVAAAIYFNLFGIKDRLISSIIENEPAYAEVYRELENRTKELEQQEAAVKQQKEELDTREKSLDKRQEQLKQKEESSTGTAAGISGTGGEAVLTEQQEENYTRIAKIYDNMEAKNVATIFENMADNAEVARIMKYMKAKSSGAVLEQMNAQMAAEISKLMTK